MKRHLITMRVLNSSESNMTNFSIDSEKQVRIRKPVVSYTFRDDDQSCHIPAELIFPDYSHSLLDINGEEPLVKVNVNEEYIVSLTDGMGHR